MPTQDRRLFLQGSIAAAGATLALAASPGASFVPPIRTPDQGNPRVRPGRVRWHDDFEAACAASTRSRKPVLLFHMLGRMDEKFC